MDRWKRNRPKPRHSQENPNQEHYIRATDELPTTPRQRVRYASSVILAVFAAYLCLCGGGLWALLVLLGHR